MIYISVFDHRGERLFGVASGEFISHMLFPQLPQLFLGRARVRIRLLNFGHNVLLSVSNLL